MIFLTTAAAYKKNDCMLEIKAFGHITLNVKSEEAAKRDMIAHSGVTERLLDGWAIGSFGAIELTPERILEDKDVCAALLALLEQKLEQQKQAQESQEGEG